MTIPQSKAKRMILDERKEAENILASPTEKYITYKVMELLCKYFYSIGCNKKQARKKLLEYCYRSSYFNYVLRQESIDRALKKGKLHIMKSSNYRIAITQNEIKKLKVLSHKDYKLALYVLFLTKLEKYQTFSSNKEKAKDLKPYFNHDLKTAYYNMANEINQNNRFMTTKEQRTLLSKYRKAGIFQPTFNQTLLVLCSDFDDKNIEFIIDANKNFGTQIKYYCSKCGKQTEKSKRHDYCKECYAVYRNSVKLESKKRLATDKTK